jgi:hypothetical protein
MTPEELNQALVELVARHRRLLEELSRVDPPEPQNERATDPRDPEPTPRKAA